MHTRKNVWNLTAIIGILFLFSVLIVAAAPAEKMSVQGRLTDPSTGDALTGTYSINFSLWDSPSSGSLQYSELLSVTPDNNGIYSVVLTPSDESIFVNPLWMGLKVDADAEMTPRINLTTSPYAYQALDLQCTNCIGGTEIDESTLDDVQVGTLTSGRACYTSGSDVDCDDDFYWNAASNYLGVGVNPSYNLHVSGTANINGLTVNSSGGVGIGVTSPSSLLHLKDGTSSGVFTSEAALLIESSSTTALQFSTSGSSGASILFGDDASYKSGEIAFNHINNELSLAADGSINLDIGTLFINTSSDRVGIGTTNPQSPLHVIGAIRVNNTGGSRDGNLFVGVSDAGYGYITSFNWTASDFMPLSLRGNVGIGNANPNASLDVTGSIRYSGNLTGYGADVAELVFVDGVVEAGDVVIITGEERVSKSSVPYDARVAGIVSTDPSHLLSADRGDIPLALAGRVPVKVSAENGPIRYGDLLTTSSTPGYAMRCVSRTACAGVMVGKAMGSLDEGTGLITALVMLG
jgi:hypothetical protein